MRMAEEKPIRQIPAKNRNLAVKEASKSFRALEEIAGDYGALDFACAFVDGDYAGVAVHAFDFGFAGVALGAVDLDGFVDYAIDHFAGVEFGGGRGVAGEAWLVSCGGAEGFLASLGMTGGGGRGTQEPRYNYGTWGNRRKSRRAPAKERAGKCGLSLRYMCGAIFLVGGVVEEQAGGFDFGVHVG